MIVHFQIDAVYKRIFSDGLDKMSLTVLDNNLKELLKFMRGNYEKI